MIPMRGAGGFRRVVRAKKCDRDRTRKSQRGGRPAIAKEIRTLIREIQAANVAWDRSSSMTTAWTECAMRFKPATSTSDTSTGRRSSTIKLQYKRLQKRINAMHVDRHDGGGVAAFLENMSNQWREAQESLSTGGRPTPERWPILHGRGYAASRARA